MTIGSPWHPSVERVGAGQPVSVDVDRRRVDGGRRPAVGAGAGAGASALGSMVSVAAGAPAVSEVALVRSTGCPTTATTTVAGSAELLTINTSPRGHIDTGPWRFHAGSVTTYEIHASRSEDPEHSEAATTLSSASTARTLISPSGVTARQSAISTAPSIFLNAYGSVMAIVARIFINSAERADHDQLERAVESRFEELGGPPDGLMVHLGYPNDGGLALVEVFRTEELFQSFLDDVLDPALDEAGLLASEPEIHPAWSIARP
jgi:hypothetical protein